MKTAAIIQARKNSTRLPDKVLMDIIGKPVLQHVIERCKRSYVDMVIVATCEPFSEIARICENTVTPMYIGSENDVMGRVLKAAEYFNIDTIIEITADCPLVCPEHIDTLLQFYEHTSKIRTDFKCYVSNCLPERAVPDGMDIQIFSTTDLWIHYRLQNNNKEHCGWNLSQSERMRKFNFYPYNKYMFPNWRLTLDTKEDFQVIEKIFNHFGRNDFSFEQIMDYILENDHILNINKNIKPKEPNV